MKPTPYRSSRRSIPWSQGGPHHGGVARRPTRCRSSRGRNGRWSGPVLDDGARWPSGGRRRRARNACDRRSTSPRRAGRRRRGPPPGRPSRSRSGARCRGRTGAPCQRFRWWVSPARPPNRTCDFHRIRLSTCSCHWSRNPLVATCPWRGDASAPIAVADNSHFLRSKHLESTGTDLPTRQEPPDERPHVQADVPLAQPAHDPPKGEVIEIAECA